MLTKEEAKEKLRALVQFYISKKSELDKESEGDIRRKLIDKMFKILGWDVYGDEDPSEVQVEESIKNEESKKKKADYVFRLHGYPELVVEAKAIRGVDMDEIKWKEQTVGYSYNLACSWAVLTNFVRTDIFYVDRENEESPIRKIGDISNLENFDENFERLWLLSKESAKNNLLEKETERLGVRATKEKVGEQLYEDLKEWRKKLSDNIKMKYDGEYKSYEIEEIVQRVIDRLIFIRKLEDMEIEERKLDQLIRKFDSHAKYYNELKNIFKYYRIKYNSGLFGEDEKSIQEPDKIEVDNEAIRLVIMGLYKPKGRKIEYNFAVIDADVLGGIYEQYLAFILKDTTKKTKLEGGRTHRKEQGIFYTPVYIVDYIVKNTVLEHTKHKSLEDVLKIKVLDPACGSGSFLIRAFGELCKIVEERLKRGERIKNGFVFDDYSERLNLHQKITILKSCIYGVDLDKKAVEIAQLNLLLKLLEGETAESMSNLGQTKKLLPMLNENIKIGNSLIDDKEIAGESAFRWEEQFNNIISYNEKHILKEGYGFDAIIGNPPWVSIKGKEKSLDLSEKELNWLFKKYPCDQYRPNLFEMFLWRALSLVKDGCFFSFIVPDRLCYNGQFADLREYILKNLTLKKLWFKPLFAGVISDNIIFVIKKEMPNKKNSVEIAEYPSTEFKKMPQEAYAHLSDSAWFIVDEKIYSIFEKIKNKSEVFELGKKFQTKVGFIAKPNKVIEKRGANEQIAVYKGENILKFGFNGNYYFEFKKLNLAGGTQDTEKLGKKNKVFLRKTGIDIIASFDSSGTYPEQSVYFIYTEEDKSEEELKVICALLNSRLLNCFYRNFAITNRDATPQLKKVDLDKFPIIMPKDANSLSEKVDRLLNRNKELIKLGNKKTDEQKNLEREINDIDKQIDQEVYNLYGITKEEQEIIENSLK